MLKVGEYLNPDYKAPGDVPEPAGMQHYYQVMGLNFIDPEHKVSKHEVRLHIDSLMQKAAQGIQVTVHEVKQDPEPDQAELSQTEGEAQSLDLQEEPPTEQEGGSVCRLLDQAIGGEPEDQEDKHLVLEAIQEYVMIPSEQPTTKQEGNAAATASTSGITTVHIQQISSDEAFDQQLKFKEDVIQCARKRHAASAAPDVATVEKIAKLEAALQHKEDQRQQLHRLIDEKDQHISALKEIISLSKDK